MRRVELTVVTTRMAIVIITIGREEIEAVIDTNAAVGVVVVVVVTTEVGVVVVNAAKVVVAEVVADEVVVGEAAEGMAVVVAEEAGVAATITSLPSMNQWMMDPDNGITFSTVL